MCSENVVTGAVILLRDISSSAGFFTPKRTKRLLGVIDLEALGIIQPLSIS
jgi:hypothetical protein